MILGIGVDIVKISRFENYTEHFASRIFTQNERTFLLTKSHQSAAGLFAAKEAVSKALGTGFSGFWPNAIEIVHNEKGRPQVVLHQEAANIANKLINDSGNCTYSFHISISHSESDAVAFVVMSGEI